MPRYDFICRTCNHRFEGRFDPQSGPSGDVTQGHEGSLRPERIPCERFGEPADRQFPRRTQFRMGHDPYEAAYQRGDMAAGD